MAAANPRDLSWPVAAVASPVRPLPLRTPTVMSPGASGALAVYGALVGDEGGDGVVPSHASITAWFCDGIGSRTSAPPTVAAVLGMVKAGVELGLKFLYSFASFSISDWLKPLSTVRLLTM